MEKVQTSENLTLFADLGRIIAEFRVRRGFSQKDFAERCDVTAPYLSQIEKGHKMPSYGLLAKICEQLGVSQNDLFRLMFVDSFLETGEESKQEAIALLRDLLDRLTSTSNKTNGFGRGMNSHNNGVSDHKERLHC